MSIFVNFKEVRSPQNDMNWIKINSKCERSYINVDGILSMTFNVYIDEQGMWNANGTANGNEIFCTRNIKSVGEAKECCKINLSKTLNDILNWFGGSKKQYNELD